MRVVAAEGDSGNDEQVVANRLGHELAGRAPGRLWEYVKRSLGLDDLEAIRQSTINAVAFAAVVGHDRGNVEVPRRYPRVLHHAWGAHERELLQRAHFFNKPFRPVDVAQPPAGHAVSLAEAVE